MIDLNQYFSRLMIRELEQFRDGTPRPPGDTAPENPQHDDAGPPPTAGQDSTMARTAHEPTATGGGEETKQPATGTHQPEQQQQPQDTTALLNADEATNGFQGTPLRLITLPNTTTRQREINGARQQRVYRLAHKFGVLPGGPRWIRDGQPYAQPAVPRSVVRGDAIEYNQFMHDDGEVVLRMPGGWKRDLVRERAAFLGVAVIDGYLWPRFSANLPRRMTVDWGKSIYDLFWITHSLSLRRLFEADSVCSQRNRASSSSTRSGTPRRSWPASPSLRLEGARTRRMVSL
jgi:hypothetical protein